jgi:hypothetical protein
MNLPPIPELLPYPDPVSSDEIEYIREKQLDPAP